MTEISLTIYSGGGSREFRMTGDRLVVGRAGGATRGVDALLLEDPGLDARQASINRDGERVWVLDESSAGGTYLNGQRVPPQGAPLADGDEIFVGEHTTIIFHLRAGAGLPGGAPRDDGEAPPARSSPALSVVVPVLCLAVLVVVAVALVADRRAAAPRAARQSDLPAPVAGQPPDGGGGGGSEDAGGEPASDSRQAEPGDGGRQAEPGAGAAAGLPRGGAKLYLQMSQEEQLRFLEERARHISVLMGNRPYAFNDEVLGHIKRYVDVYARRVGNNSQRMWGEDLRTVFGRARTRYVPHIIRAFNARHVPPVVGLYLVMIETEYHNIAGENFAGAAGLFQFVGPTARAYGVDPSERTNVEKMAPAAAHYMADRIAEFGPDSMSVALAIAGYNRSPDSVRRDLRDVLDLHGSSRERSFWTLVANSDRLDHYFQNENVKYVPKFFAAAIVGENPEAFGLDMRKLSTYTTTPAEGDAAGAQPSPAAKAASAR